MVICQEQGAYDLHMVQLMRLPRHHLLLHYNSEWFNLSGAGLVVTHVLLEKRPLNECLSVCLSVCLSESCLLIFILYLL